MLGFNNVVLLPKSPITVSIPRIGNLIYVLPPITALQSVFPQTLNFKAQRNPRMRIKYIARAENANGQSTDPKEEETEKKEDGGFKKNTNNGVNGSGGEEDLKGKGAPKFNLRWLDLLLDRDPDNIIAVGLTGLLTWASVQVLWQLLFISVAILVAALKYSFIAAFLLFILITLL